MQPSLFVNLAHALRSAMSICDDAATGTDAGIYIFCSAGSGDERRGHRRSAGRPARPLAGSRGGAVAPWPILAARLHHKPEAGTTDSAPGRPGIQSSGVNRVVRSPDLLGSSSLLCGMKLLSVVWRFGAARMSCTSEVIGAIVIIYRYTCVSFADKTRSNVDDSDSNTTKVA